MAGAGGAPWRDVPERYGPWQSMYWLSRTWQRAGVWALIVTGLLARAGAAGLICWDVSVDSTVVRVRQHAAGARRDPLARVEPVLGEPVDHGLGRCRGGLTTRLHLACEQGQKVMSLVLAAGQRGDSPQFAAVLERIRVPGLIHSGGQLATHKHRQDHPCENHWCPACSADGLTSCRESAA